MINFSYLRLALFRVTLIEGFQTVLGEMGYRT